MDTQVTLGLDDIRVSVVGLGYVGLPLAVYMGAQFPTLGFDIDDQRIAELCKTVDRTGEVTAEEFARAKTLNYTSRPDDLKDCNFHIVTVPTPIDEAKQPDLTAIRRATETVGRQLQRGGYVVYESTVYPGATEEVCVPILEATSGLKLNEGFFVGYSPERINPGDHEHRLPSIIKLTSGSTPEAADLIDAVYRRIITAGTRRVSSIRVAEAGKVIENVQRDANIALVNEFAMLFKALGIDTSEVLAAAGSKWNFHNYKPGLVGGHCIGVDPYYLTYKARSIGFHPEMILAGRRINDNMASFVAQDVIKMMLRRKFDVASSRILVLGFTFKENCPDLRNTKVADLVRELRDFTSDVDVYDPLADPDEAEAEYGIKLTSELPDKTYDTVVLTVRHDEFVNGDSDIRKSLLKPGGLIYDVKGVLPSGEADATM
ncbi:MAG: nucleotide sugar dehydrogenase [Hyphomicrobiaceae bacterium]